MTKRAPSVDPLDVAAIAAGVLAVVFSFRDYYTVSVLDVDDSTSAWHGFFGWFGTLLAALAAAVLAVGLIAAPRTLPVPPPFVALALFVLAAGSTVVALSTSGFEAGRRPAGAPPIDSGHGYGYWTCLAVIIAGVVLTGIRTRRTGRPSISPRRPKGPLGFKNEGAQAPGEGDTT